ncbi:LOW QUALITY PROTEIN: polycomb group protein Psc-like [Atheta coriaria]|uniref:LOW QUALITY PROTEIN: polycomb group protein Psc-like n=1 Tax=Dalotia coriaria TaxID=877792 RepID=UPI0031F40AA1
MSSLEIQTPKEFTSSSSSSAREKKVLLKDLNSLLTCTLCNGYFIEAMTFDSCLHSFCRSCVLNHFETTKQQTCPKCDKKKAFFKPDHQLQALVYKMVPGLFGKETQRREDFYRSSMRASSTCSEDSVLGDVQKDQAKWLLQSDGPSGRDTFFSPEDPISLSLEFYQLHLDDTKELDHKLSMVCKRTRPEVDLIKKESDCDKSEKKVKADRRYLQCPAAVSMSHLQKFLRMKYALSSEHRVDIIYEGEVLPFSYTLMDVAYTYNWTKLKPMRFFYRIFTPLKVQPIKIINTSSSNGSKQLQIVPVRSTSNNTTNTVDLEAEKSKEQFVAQLKLQSKHKNGKAVMGSTAENCVFEYAEADEEIKRFAESRDREWARMRHEDVVEPQNSNLPSSVVVPSITPQISNDGVMIEGGGSSHHVKKRKKSKHSKGEAKKPKIHAEITSEVVLQQQESIKLKVKLTPAHQHGHNGHKHKHRSPPVPPLTPSTTSTPVQHQHQQQTQQQPPLVPKPISTPPQVPLPIKTPLEVRKPEPVKKLHDVCIKKADKHLETTKKDPKKLTSEKPTRSDLKPHPSPVLTMDIKKKEEQKAFLKTFQSGTNARSQPITKVQSPNKADSKKPMITYSNHTKQNFDKKIASLKQQALNKQKLDLTTTQKEKKVSFSLDKPHILNSQQYPSGFTVSKVEQGIKRKQESDPPVEKRPCLEITLINPKPESQSLNHQNSKPKPPASPAPHRITTTTTSDPPKAKRPPPATIPLDRIKNPVKHKPENSQQIPGGALDLTKKIEPVKNGITTLNGMKFPSPITTSSSPTTPPTMSLTENLQMLSKVALQHSRQQAQQNKPRPQIPNLQTLRIPHVTTSGTTPSSTPTNTLARSPNQATTGSSPQRSIPNLANLPKLNEISKSNLKMLSNHNNNLNLKRSNNNNNQNMIRSIPNPALLVRQHNQSRMSLTNGQGQTQGQNSNQTQEKEKNQPKILNPLAKENTTTTTTTTKDNKDNKDLFNNTKTSVMDKMMNDHNKALVAQMAESTTAAT